MPKVTIKRSSEFESKIRKFKIEINGKFVALISDGEEKIIDVNPGINLVKAKIDWCTSNTLELNVKNDSEVKLYLCSGSGLSIYRITFGWNEYLNLSLITINDDIS